MTLSCYTQLYPASLCFPSTFLMSYKIIPQNKLTISLLKAHSAAPQWPSRTSISVLQLEPERPLWLSRCLSIQHKAILKPHTRHPSPSFSTTVVNPFMYANIQRIPGVYTSQWLLLPWNLKLKVPKSYFYLHSDTGSCRAKWLQLV